MSNLFSIIKPCIRNLLFSLAFLPFILEADMDFVMKGKFTKVTSTHVIAEDLVYELLSTTKVILKNDNTGTFEQLNKGDDIVIMILKLDNKYFAESIHQLPDETTDQ